MKPQQVKTLRGSGVSMIFQDPTMSLNPVFTIGEQMMEINGQPLPVRASMGMLTQPISFLGLPVTTVPLRTAQGAPIGLQLIAAPFNEQACLRVARVLEERGITDARPAEIA